MFGKLLAYEFKAVGKWYLGLYALALLSSAAMGIFIRTQDYNSDAFGVVILNVILFITFGASMAGLGLSTFFLIVSRFRQNIFGRQGYLTMTLPATTHQILISKLVVAVLWMLLAAITFILSGLIIISLTEGIPIASLIDSLKGLSQYGVDWLNWVYLLNFLISPIIAVLILYLAITLGHSAQEHRIFLSIIAYIIIEIFINTVEWSILYQNEWSHSSFPITSFILRVVWGLLAYFSTHYLITHRLNIQ